MAHLASCGTIFLGKETVIAKGLQILVAVAGERQNHGNPLFSKQSREFQAMQFLLSRRSRRDSTQGNIASKLELNVAIA